MFPARILTFVMSTRSMLARSASVPPSWRMRRAKALLQDGVFRVQGLMLCKTPHHFKCAGMLMQRGRGGCQGKLHLQVLQRSATLEITCSCDGHYRSSVSHKPAHIPGAPATAAQRVRLQGRVGGHERTPPGRLQLALRPVALMSARAALRAPQAQDCPGLPGRLMAPSVPIASTLMWGKLRNTYRSLPLPCVCCAAPLNNRARHGHRRKLKLMQGLSFLCITLGLEESA